MLCLKSLTIIVPRNEIQRQLQIEHILRVWKQSPWRLEVESDCSDRSHGLRQSQGNVGLLVGLFDRSLADADARRKATADL